MSLKIVYGAVRERKHLVFSAGFPQRGQEPTASCKGRSRFRFTAQPYQ